MSQLQRLRDLVDGRRQGWCDPDARPEVPAKEKYVRAAECLELLALIDHVLEEKERGPGTDTGHGHVWRRPDGYRARCGGPGICYTCKKDYARWGGEVAKADLAKWQSIHGEATDDG